MAQPDRSRRTTLVALGVFIAAALMVAVLLSRPEVSPEGEAPAVVGPPAEPLVRPEASAPPSPRAPREQRRTSGPPDESGDELLDGEAELTLCVWDGGKGAPDVSFHVSPSVGRSNVTTGPSGCTSLSVPAGQDLRIHPMAAVSPPFAEVKWLALNARRTVDFALPTLCDVTLEVVDQDGAVVPDFDVKARPESEGMSTSRTEQEGTTDADGLVSFALPCGPRWMVNFEGPGAQMAFGLGEPPDAPFELVVDTSRRGEEIWLRLESAADGEALHGWFRQQPGVPRPAHRIPREGVLLGPLDPDVTYIVATNRHEPTSFAPADLAPVPDDDGRRWATLVLTPHGEIEVIAEPSASDRIETVTCVEPAGASHGCRRLTGQPRWTCRCSDEGGFAMKVRIMDVDVLQPVVRPETRLQPIPPAAELCLEAGTCGGAADDVVLISLPDHPWGGGCGSRTDAVDSRCLRVPRGERLHIACWAVGEMVAWETEIVAGEERNVVLGD